MNGRLPRFAIVNPLTLIGKELRSILHARGTQFSHIELVDTTGEAGGTVTEVADEAAVVKPASRELFADVDLVFVCGSGTDDNAWVDDVVNGRIIDFTGTISGARPIVAGVNDDRIGDSGPLASPHPATVLLTHLLSVLRAQGEMTEAAATILQPASSFDQKGVDELFEQTVAALNMQSQPREVFDRQLAFNMYPAVDAEQQETLIASELAAIGSEDGERLALTVVQSTAFHGISVSLFARFTERVDAAALTAALSRASGVEIRTGEDAASTIDAAGIDEILIGRVQTHPGIPGGVTIWAVVDNLRRGTALNAVLIAEVLTSREVN